MSPPDARPRVRIVHAVLWLAAIALVMVGIDLAERFAFYEIRPRDRTSFPRMVRRPIKDTGMALLHGAAGPLDLSALPEGVPVFDFHLKPQDEQALLAHMTRVRVIGTHDEFSRSAIPARRSSALPNDESSATACPKRRAGFSGGTCASAGRSA